MLHKRLGISFFVFFFPLASKGMYILNATLYVSNILLLLIIIIKERPIV